MIIILLDRYRNDIILILGGLLGRVAHQPGVVIPPGGVYGGIPASAERLERALFGNCPPTGGTVAPLGE